MDRNSNINPTKTHQNRWQTITGENPEKAYTEEETSKHASEEKSTAQNSVKW